MSDLFKKIIYILYKAEISGLKTFTFKRGCLYYKFTSINKGYLILVKEQITINHYAVVANLKIDTESKHNAVCIIFDFI